MRKQTKIAALVSATALLALGASITSFAAARGTWMLVDGEWYCYDKNGDPYENTFCVSNGKDYYVGEDGMLVRSDWVEYDGDYYFVNSAGQKITNDWRLTTPYDDEGAEEEWYYFQSSGKMATGKKIVYKGSTYFFNSEGRMLTGWVTYDSDNAQNVDEANGFEDKMTFYADETGARVESNWVLTTEPGVEEDDADADYYYYWLKSNGQAATGKQTNIKGQMYFFDEQGRMLSGWVAATKDDADETYYMEIDGENSDYVVNGDWEAVYYCGASDDGHAKKDKWIKTWRPADTYEEDEDEDEFWYWIDKSGKIYVPSDTNAAAVGNKYSLEEGAFTEKTNGISISQKKINSKDYFFNEAGEMLSNFILVTTPSADLTTGMYYFGGADDGSMKTGSISVKDDVDDTYKFYFETKGDNKGVGIVGNKSNKLYNYGMLIKSEDYKYEIADVNGHLFIVNQNGSIQRSNVEYKEDGDVLIDANDFVFNKENDADTWKYEIISGTGVSASINGNDLFN